MAKKSQKAYLRGGRVLKKKSTVGDFLDRLRKMVSSDVEEKDDFRESPSPEPRQSNQLPGKNSSSSSQKSVEEEAAKMIKSIFKCSVCLTGNVNTSSRMFHLLCRNWLCALSRAVD